MINHDGAATPQKNTVVSGRHLSFKKAADELGVTPTAISHQIRLLEETLGSRLFDRQTRRVALTSAGQLLYPALRESFDRMAGAIAAVNAKGNGAVTITTTMAFASKWLAPRIARFAKIAPDIAIRILATDVVVELETGAADLAIRYGSGPYKGYRSDLLLETSYAPFAAQPPPFRPERPTKQQKKHPPQNKPIR